MAGMASTGAELSGSEVNTSCIGGGQSVVQGQWLQTLPPETHGADGQQSIAERRGLTQLSLH